MKNFLEKRKDTKAFLNVILKDDIDIHKLKELIIIDDSQLEIFLNNLKVVKEDIKKDQQFIYDNDPAVNDVECILSYTSLFAITAYRIAHIFPCEKFARQITEYAKSITGIDIHPKTKIGVPFAIDHGVGIVIGETTVIGNNSMLYHGVTLGSKFLNERDQIGQDRHPKLGDNVTIYAKTTIVGNINIYDNMVIGSNMFIKSQEQVDELQFFLNSKKNSS